MRTTIELPDDLLLEAKRAALDRRITLRELTIEGLRLALRSGEQPRRRLRDAPIQLRVGHELPALTNEQAAKVLSEEESNHLNEVYRGH